ncbi:hypothetical protein TRVA0_024S01244 [Trichomonascus vanleenenianus]|uniref:MFS transporter n=1 Tax=Trichomonascus vanleenenianus TaxID=2268995 RepID=UPI003ECB9C06
MEPNYSANYSDSVPLLSTSSMTANELNETSVETVHDTGVRDGEAKDTQAEVSNNPLDSVSESDESTDKLYGDEFDPVYIAKAKVISDAISEIGMGRYQWVLFVVAGFGWMADNMWPIVTSLILPQIALEFLPTGSTNGPYLTLAQNLGLLAGAVFWSFSSDIIGRRWAFNLTFLISGVWGIIAGSAPNFAAIGIFASFWSFGVGGNLPVDSAIFLEVLPQSHQYLLTIMSVWWAFGQLLTTLVAWGLLGNYSCQRDEVCTKENNMGWRYLCFTIGGISIMCWASRFLMFTLHESPKFYVSRGRDDLAVEVVHKIAAFNRRESTLSLEQLQEVDRLHGNEEETHDVSAAGVAKEKLEKYNFSHLREVFGTRKLAYSSSLVIFVWALIGVAFPLYNAFLPYYLSTRGSAGDSQSTDITYRNTLIIAAIGVPGALLAGVLVELRIGRKGAIALSTILTGVFLFGSTTAKTSDALLGWNCMFSFFSNIMYGVLYAYTPEIFPARVRGTAVGLAASANRVLGVFAPIIAKFANLTTSVPIFVSGAMFLAAGVVVLLFPYEPRGKASL